MSDIEVEVSELHTHAKNVDSIAEQVANCAKTAQGIDFGLDTFGVVGQVFAAFIKPNSQQQAANLNSAVDAVRGVSKNLDATADIYEQSDSDNADLFSGIEGGL
ncbi:type VII secretion target [Kutzneria sp. CA-103260]|uniref:type VII secretion target n=1 Tax=Kutzneria sp. CA-103260 TaxID=2802641 RepID=UPI001BA98D0B|nr:type VII secretion target [Kutzneria sp. CA-103260]QUQ67922.1 Excreted virulence factor EspC, type VII ESX diderm [Kutzneria sp. CA-103260]